VTFEPVSSRESGIGGDITIEGLFAAREIDDLRWGPGELDIGYRPSPFFIL
jgi:hypothetical protein